VTGGHHHAEHSTTLRDYLQVLRRRKWIVLQAVVLVPLAAVLFSLNQQTLYQASAQVLLSSQNLAAQLTNTQSTGINLQPDRIAQTQAGVARVPVIASRVLRRVGGTGLTVDQFLSDSSVSTSPNADLLGFTVTNHDPQLARRLVDAYAREYTIYRRQLDTGAINTALKSATVRLKQLSRAGGRNGALYSSLVDRQQTLATMAALQTANATVIKRADGATQIQPRPKRNAILGLALGIVLGLGLAFLWEALDTRVRSAQEIGEKLGGLPLLARLPAPGKKLRAENRLVMLDDPSSVSAETFRMLRTNLDFVMLDRRAKTIMVTSAVEQEGKSTTIANLAVALARAGQRVALVDLDLRRPFLAKFFDLDGPGITQVALGHATLDDALVRVAITNTQESRNVHVEVNGNGSGASGNATVKGLLEVLPAGPIPPDPGEFVATQALAEILDELRDRADVVLVDAPPALRVGDAMTLTSRVDGILVVTRMKIVRRHMLSELGRQLASVPTPVLGFVVTDAAGEDEGYGYGYGGYYARSYAPSETSRVKTGS
jgi:Mrp family chromosome partitioning ATPase/capsular polysaccharide biosynthesis protein